MNIQYLDELRAILDSYGISQYDVCLSGSEILAAENIRVNHDLDIVLRPAVRKLYRSKLPRGYRWRINLTDHIELYRNHLHFIGILDEDIFGRGWFVVHDGFKTIPIEIAYLIKKALHREKDKKDLEQILERFPDIEARAKQYQQSNLKMWCIKVRTKLKI